MRASAAVFFMAGSTYFAVALGVIRGIVVMRYVGVMGRGLMQSVHVINRYTGNAHLGILHGLSKELPLKIGAGDDSEAEAIEASGMTWVVALTALAALGMCIWGISEPTEERPTTLALVIGAGWLLASQTYNLYRCVLRSWGNFRLLSYLTAIDAAAAFGLTIYGAYRWGFLGAMLGMLAAWLLDLIILHFYSGVRIRPNWHSADAIRLFKTGLLILAITFTDTLLRTIDGAVIIRYYEAYRIGLYSVGMQMAGYMFTLPEAAGFVIWPKIIEAWGASGDLRNMRRHVQLPTQVSASVMPLLAGSAHILLPLLIVWIVPEFVNSIQAGQILAWGGIFLALPLATNSVLIATNRELSVIITRGLSGLALGAVSYWLVRQQAPIEHIAAAAAGAYAVASLLSLLLVLPKYFTGRQLAVELAGCYLPTLWAVVSLKLASSLAASFVMPHPADPLWASLYLFFFVCLYVPGVVYGKYHTGLWQELRVLWQQRKARKSGTNH